MVRTKMTSASLDKNPDYYINRIPIGRVDEPEDVAEVIANLLRTDENCLDGQDIIVRQK